MDYSIKNTTKSQREEIVKRALAISVSGADALTEKATMIVRQYIDGKKELKEVQDAIISMYKK